MSSELKEPPTGITYYMINSSTLIRTVKVIQGNDFTLMTEKMSEYGVWDHTNTSVTGYNPVSTAEARSMMLKMMEGVL